MPFVVNAVVIAQDDVHRRAENVLQRRIHLGFVQQPGAVNQVLGPHQTGKPFGFVQGLAKSFAAHGGRGTGDVVLLVTGVLGCVAGQDVGNALAIDRIAGDGVANRHPPSLIADVLMNERRQA